MFMYFMLLDAIIYIKLYKNIESRKKEANISWHNYGDQAQGSYNIRERLQADLYWYLKPNSDLIVPRSMQKKLMDHLMQELMNH